MKIDFAEIQAQLLKLRLEYAAELPGKFADVESSWQKLSAGQWDPLECEVFHRLVHTLAGSGGSFGYDQVSASARSIEKIAQVLMKENIEANEEQREQIQDFLGDLREAIAISGAANEGGDVGHIADSPGTIAAQDPLIYLIEDDRQLADELVLQLSHFGYRCQAFVNAADVQTAMVVQQPAAFITDLTLPAGPLAGAELMSDLRHQYGSQSPVIFISARDDFSARLTAARAGGEAYFVKPLEISPLIDRLDQLTSCNIEEPYRILVVDDDAALAMHYSLVLRQAGMEVTTVTRPDAVIKALAEVNPDLILMDVYMPGCSGLELAVLIRQEEAYIGVPIVFLSSETDQSKQFSAMRSGGDEFLTKPIDDQRLTSSVTVRAQRARMISSLMIQDSLTGLLKHTSIKELLASEVSRAIRSNSKLSFAMVDIDHFKKVNDTYGHAMGDRVIKSLARLLKQRLRISDGIGRYGGEEFAVVLPDCDLNSGVSVIDGIRKDFADIRFQHDGQEFSLSFSAGVAQFPAYASAETLNKAADDALYHAKKAGRNEVVAAPDVTEIMRQRAKA